MSVLRSLKSINRGLPEGSAGAKTQKIRRGRESSTPSLCLNTLSRSLFSAWVPETLRANTLLAVSTTDQMPTFPKKRGRSEGQGHLSDNFPRERWPAAVKAVEFLWTVQVYKKWLPQSVPCSRRNMWSIVYKAQDQPHVNSCVPNTSDIRVTCFCCDVESHSVVCSVVYFICGAVASFEMSNMPQKNISRLQSLRVFWSEHQHKPSLLTLLSLCVILSHSALRKPIHRRGEKNKNSSDSVWCDSIKRQPYQGCPLIHSTVAIATND